ncbi:hypothetical protein [Candidatus Nitrososphaera gargensis]|nr:hypothetical protein [Candidatus Nitrososphaera gargensis]
MSMATVLLGTAVVLHLINHEVFHHNAAYAQDTTTVLADTEALIVIVNIERIRTQLELTEKSLNTDDLEMAFAHAFIPHTTTFPAIKSQLRAIDEQPATQLEAMLTDLPIKIRTAGKDSEGEARDDIKQIQTLLDKISQKAIGSQLMSDKGMVSKTVVFLLRDAAQSYQVSNAAAGGQEQFSQVDYENAISITARAESTYQIIAPEIDKRRRGEIDSFIAELLTAFDQKSDIMNQYRVWLLR